MSSLYIPDVSPLSGELLTTFSRWSVDCLFTLMVVSFTTQINLLDSHLLIFCYCFLDIGVFSYIGFRVQVFGAF